MSTKKNIINQNTFNQSNAKLIKQPQTISTSISLISNSNNNTTDKRKPTNISSSSNQHESNNSVNSTINSAFDLTEKKNNLSIINNSNSSSGTVKVMCRFRPISEKERTTSKSLCTEYMDASTVSVKMANDLNPYTFTFDRIFSPKSSQQEVFDISAKPIIESVLEGFNGTIFAYGQTASGKTYTMMGDLGNLDEEGIIPRMVKHVFNYIGNYSSEVEYIVKMSMMEVYKERIRDLIETQYQNLNIREDKQGSKGIFVEGLSEHYVACEEEVMDLIHQGSENRAVATTKMNEHSSRSHSVLQLTIKSTNVEDLTTKTGRLFLVDLAGSEKISKTGADGETLEEAKLINSSLTTLGMVINSLTDEKSKHIPYRESKITRILQESLGGNAKTCLIITCSPSSFNEAETLSTLRFGMRAKKIENKPKINKEISAAELKIEVDRLDGLLHESELRISYLEKYISNNGLQVPKSLESNIKEKTAFSKKPSIKIKSNTSFNDEEEQIKDRSISTSTKPKSRTSEDIKQDNRILNLISENKHLTKKLREVEDTLSRYIIEATERDSQLREFFESKYKREEIEKENVSKIEFLERRIKKLKFEEKEREKEMEKDKEPDYSDPIQKKLSELIKLVSDSAPGIEFYEKACVKELEQVLTKYKSKNKWSPDEDEEVFYISKNSVPDIKEIEEKYIERIKKLNKEKDLLLNSEREKIQALSSLEKQSFYLKEKIELMESESTMTLEEKNYLKRIESLESSLQKVNILFHQMNIKKSVLSIENDVQSKMIRKKNEIIDKLELGIEQYKDKEKDELEVILLFSLKECNHHIKVIKSH